MEDSEFAIPESIGDYVIACSYGGLVYVYIYRYGSGR